MKKILLLSMILLLALLAESQTFKRITTSQPNYRWQQYNTYEKIVTRCNTSGVVTDTLATMDYARDQVADVTAQLNDTVLFTDVGYTKSQTYSQTQTDSISEVINDSIVAKTNRKANIASPTFTGKLTLTHSLSGNYIISDGGTYLRRIAGSTSYYNTVFGDHAGTELRSSIGNTAIGNYALTNDSSGYYNTSIGRYTLLSNKSGNENTAIGYGAGYTTTGSGNVFLGAYAGYRETGSNKLYIANTDYTTEADGKTKSLIYGTFTATTANQTLRINAGKVTILPLPPTYADNTAALAGGLVAGDIYMTSTGVLMITY